MTKLKSGPHICADKIMIASATQSITTSWLRKGYEQQVTLPTASTCIHQLYKAGALKKTGRGSYVAIPQKVEAYYKNVTFHPAQKSTIKKVQQSGYIGEAAPKRDVFSFAEEDTSATPPVAHPDIDIINSLLDAIATAEPVLQKYKRMCEAAHS